jgi:signal transduction histidine kinase
LLQQALGHELPNHLVAVQGMARLLDAEAADRLGPDGKEYVQRLGAAAQRAHELVRGLADIVRVYRTPGAMTRVSLADVIRDVAAELQAKGASRPLEFQLPEHGPLLPMPAVASRQMVSHLLRFMVQGEHPADRSPVVVCVRETPAGVEWSLTDPAPVLGATERGRLFEPFAARNGTAHGLGLVPARLLVENCGGTLHAASTPDRGTTLFVMFPTEK